MKQTSMLILLSLLISMGLSAQEPFFMHKKGLTVTLVTKNAKGKVSNYGQTTVTDVEGEPANCTVTYETQIMDDKQKPLLTQPMVTKVTITDGVVKFDPSTFAGQLVEGMQISGDNLLLPATATVGDELNDYSITATIGPMKTTSAFSGIKVTATETLDIDGTSVDCLVVESTVISKVIGIKQEMKYKTWYGRGIGTIKTETYNKKGKLQTVQEATSIIF